MKLCDRLRPQCLDDIAGQSWIVEQLRLWLEQPFECAFLFSGGTGVGKTSMAIALARELGIAVDSEEFGGLYQISSGEQTGESVRRAMNALQVRPFLGSGWKMLVVNECEAMSPNAAYVWLDALERISPRSVIVFTTNSSAKLPARFRDRCEHFAFVSGYLALKPDLQDFAARVWLAETGRNDCPAIETFGGLVDSDGEVSFRRLLQLMEPRIRRLKTERAVSV